MAYTRKYKAPKNYERGGRVIADDQRGDAPARYSFEPEANLALQRALQAAEHADELAQMKRQHADELAQQQHDLAEERAVETQSLALETAPPAAPAPSSTRDYIARLEPVDVIKYRAAAFHHALALSDGVPDDSPEMEQRIEQGCQDEIRRGVEKAAQNVMARAAPPLPEPPKQSSLPYSAPVSRSSPDLSTGRPQNSSGADYFDPATGRGSKMRLSSEERDIARRSYSAPDMSDAQKEYAYAMNKRKMLIKRENGEIS